MGARSSLSFKVKVKRFHPAASGQPITIWKYNVMYHLAIEHTDLSMGNATVPKIPVEFLVETFITS